MMRKRISLLVECPTSSFHMLFLSKNTSSASSGETLCCAICVRFPLSHSNPVTPLSAGISIPYIHYLVVVVSRMAWYTAGDQSGERVDTMVTMLITCRHCGSPDLTKYGIAPNGKQKYRCRTCGRQSRQNPGSAA